MPGLIPDHQADSVRGFTREDLYPAGVDIPPWPLEAEQLHGHLLKSGCIALPDGRRAHLTSSAHPTPLVRRVTYILSGVGLEKDWLCVEVWP